MANYYAQTRTNYFPVKDAEKFKAECEAWQVEVITQKQEDGTEWYGLIDSDDNGGGLSWTRYADDEAEEDEERDWVEWLGTHVADGHLAVLMEVGSEKYRYFNGIAWAVNSKGESVRISLDDIYELATTKLGGSVTSATY